MPPGAIVEVNLQMFQGTKKDAVTVFLWIALHLSAFPTSCSKQDPNVAPSKKLRPLLVHQNIIEGLP